MHCYNVGWVFKNYLWIIDGLCHPSILLWVLIPVPKNHHWNVTSFGKESTSQMTVILLPTMLPILRGKNLHTGESEKKMNAIQYKKTTFFEKLDLFFENSLVNSTHWWRIFEKTKHYVLMFFAVDIAKHYISTKLLIVTFDRDYFDAQWTMVHLKHL